MLRLIIGSSVVAAALVGLLAPLGQPASAARAPRSTSAQSISSERLPAPIASSSTSARVTRDDNVATDAASLTLMTLLLLSGGDTEVAASDPHR